MKKLPSATSDALAIADGLIGDDPGLRDMIAQETMNAEVAHLIHEARTTAGLTQQQLADMIGTSQPVIARLEDGKRCWAQTERDPSLMRRMETEETIGKKGLVTARDNAPNSIKFFS